MLKIIDLHKSYGTKEVIKGLNLGVEDGKIYGFIGHNGSGKTTTIKAICGIHTFEKGDILINGLSIKDNDIECKKIMAYIPDNPDLYENMKAITYLNFIANIYQMDTNIAKNRIEYLAKELEIYDNLSDQIKSLSRT